MTDHRWSGWPGAYCLDCGCGDPFEVALAEGNFIEVADNTEMGFHYEFPNVIAVKCPGSYNMQMVMEEREARNLTHSSGPSKNRL
jgi:hypothetical protein